MSLTFTLISKLWNRYLPWNTMSLLKELQCGSINKLNLKNRLPTRFSDTLPENHLDC